MKQPGWEARLAAEIDAARVQRFVWGQHDCATWAFNVRRALTGWDGAILWRGRYSTEIGAARMLRRLGFDSLEGLVRGVMGAAPLSTPLLAQRGDLVLGGEPEAVGVCIGAMAAFLAQDGLTMRPMAECRLAWRV